MGLFDKKYCGVCGQKIGLLGNRKLEDANLCKDCASKLSPWFSERRNSTLEEIKSQLQYREENKKSVEAFQPTRSFGKNTKVLIDDSSKSFLVTSASNWRESNPDVMKLSDVTDCEIDINETKRELKDKDAEGKPVSFNPPRYEFSHDIYCEITVNNPFFNNIRFRVNPSTIKSEAVALTRLGTVRAPMTIDYQQSKAIAENIKHALLSDTIKTDVQENKVEPKSEVIKTVVCSFCGATTQLDVNGCCEYCGSKNTES